MSVLKFEKTQDPEDGIDLSHIKFGECFIAADTEHSGVFMRVEGGYVNLSSATTTVALAFHRVKRISATLVWNVERVQQA